MPDYQSPDIEEDAYEYPKNISGILSDSKQDKQNITRIFDLSILYLEGRQHLFYDRTNGVFQATRLRAGQNRVVVNLLLNLYRNILSRLATDYPGVTVLPASPSPEDINKSQASEVALQYYWAAEGMKDKLHELIGWLLSCGNAALHSYYDPGDKVVRTSVVSPYDIFFEQGVNSPDESEFMSIRSFISKKDLKAAYPKYAKEIEERNSADPGDEYRWKRNTINFPKNRVEIYETHWDDGKYAITMGDTYLYKGKNPKGWTPIQFIRYTTIPSRLWGIGLISPLIDLQNQYNKARAQVLDNTELMTNPKWLIPKTSGIAPSSITAKAGEKIYYNPAGGQPTQISGAPIPSYVFDNIRQLQNEIMDVSGAHSTTLGKRAIGITSGKAINALTAQDVSQLNTTQENIEKGAKDLAITVLLLMKTYYKESTMMRMMDRTGSVIFKELKNTNLVDTPEILFEAGSLFRNEKQDRDAKLIELVQMGMLDPKLAMKEMSLKTYNSYLINEMADRRHAEDMLQAAVENVGEVEIFADDNVKIFKEVFKDFMRSPHYYDLEQERQDYIADIFATLSNHGKPVEEYAQARHQKIFPPFAKEEGVVDLAQFSESPQSQEQIIGEEMRVSQKGGGAEAIKAAQITKRPYGEGTTRGGSMFPGG